MTQRQKGTQSDTDWTTLKRKFFHDFDEEGFVKHQGQILDFVNEEIAIVQYFDWIIGSPSAIRAVWLRDIVDGGWELYSSVEVMRDAYEHGHVRSRTEKNTS